MLDLSLVRMEPLEQGYKMFPDRYSRSFHVGSCEKLLEDGGGLVVAPTGSGKTTIALYLGHALLARGISTWFTTPTNKLNQQHLSYLRKYSLCPQRIHLLSAHGERTLPANPCILISTVHLFRIVTGGLWDGAVIIDEAHHISEHVPYDFLAHRKTLTFGLTASPGVSRESIKGVLRFLNSRCILFRTFEGDIQLRDVQCPLPETYAQAYRSFARLVENFRAKLLQSVPALRYGEAITLLKQGIGDKRFELSKLVSLQWALALLGAHDLSLFKSYVARSKLRTFLEKNARAALLLDQSHPKLELTRKLVAEFRQQGLRGIIFTTFKQIQQRLHQRIPGLGILRGGVGKAGRSSQEALNAFRQGRIDWVVATSVAEEGLDIPGAQVVIAYDVPKETKKYIQRRGRVGRHSRGILVNLFSLKSEEIRLEKIRKGEQRMYDNLESF